MCFIATDNHVGYLEKDQVRGSDSLEAFEEVLKIAQDQQASSYWTTYSMFKIFVEFDIIVAAGLTVHG